MDENLKEALRYLDKSRDVVFSLATGSLALSVTFRENLAPEGAIESHYLMSTWVSLLVCIFGYILGLGVRSSMFLSLYKYPEPKGIVQLMVNVANLISLLLLLSGFYYGLLCLVRFGIANVA